MHQKLDVKESYSHSEKLAEGQTGRRVRIGRREEREIPSLQTLKSTSGLF